MLVFRVKAKAMVPYPCPAVSQTIEGEAGLLIFFELLYICNSSIFTIVMMRLRIKKI